MNKCIFSGLIVTELSLSRTKGNEERSPKPVLNFTIAVRRRFSKDHKPMYVHLTAFGKIAENIAANFSKGSWIYVETSVFQDRYTDSKGNYHNELAFRIYRYEADKKKITG